MGLRVSRRCSSLREPSVTTLRICVCPRVNSPVPCVRGRTPTSQVMGRTCVRSRPSARTFSLEDAVSEDLVDGLVEGARHLGAGNVLGD